MLSNEFIYRLINVNYIRYTYIFITTREKRKETYTKKESKVSGHCAVPLGQAQWDENSMN